jgi:uncharacterized membrane protein YecN with MAPEG domain
MMMHLLNGVALWMVAAVALGMFFGRAMHGYGVRRQPVPLRLAEAKGHSPFDWAA